MPDHAAPALISVMELLAPPERQLLHACLGEGEAARAAFAAWRPHGQPGTLDGRYLRLMPLLHANLTRLGVEDPMLNWLRGLSKHNWLIGLLRKQRVEEVLAAFAAAELPVVLIKGAALLARWPAQTDTRPMGDFDLLAPAGRMREALAILRGIGWQAPAPHLLSAGDLAQGHAIGVRARQDIWIDLHWRPAAAVGDPAHAEAVLARAVPGRFGGREVAVAGLADHLFVLLAHAFFNAADRRIDWVAEAAALLDRAGGALDWRLFGTLTQRYRLQSWNRLALAEIAGFMETALPAEAWPEPGSSKLRWGAVERREIAARAADPPTAVDAAIRAVGDRRRGAHGSGPAVADPLLLMALGGLPAVGRLLKPPALLRLAGLGGLNLASLGRIGDAGFTVDTDDAGTSFLAGWSGPERSGRWSDGAQAWALFAVPAHAPGAVTVILRINGIPAALAPVIPQTDAKIWLGGATHRVGFEDGITPPGPVTLGGRILRWRGRNVLPLAIRITSELDPLKRGMNTSDKRRLGLFLEAIELQALLPAPV